MSDLKNILNKKDPVKTVTKVKRSNINDILSLVDKTDMNPTLLANFHFLSLNKKRSKIMR